MYATILHIMPSFDLEIARNKLGFIVLVFYDKRKNLNNGVTMIYSSTHFINECTLQKKYNGFS
jgi:hypothetical protein